MRPVTGEVQVLRARAWASRAWNTLIRRPLGRWLHQSRRRAALRRLRAGRDHIRSVVFVCQGNICRSPYAAAAFRKLLANGPTGIEVSSVGFLASDRPAPSTAIEAAAGRGIDLVPHRSQRVDADRVRAADLVVVMDPRQARRIRVTYGPRRDQVLILADLLSAFPEGRTIPDPIEQPLEVFESVYGQIDQCLAAMRSALRGEAG